MNQHNFGERFNRWGDTERAGKDASRQDVSSNLLAGEVPVDAEPIDMTLETPTGATLPHDEPLAEMMPDEPALGDPVISAGAGSLPVPSVAQMTGTITSPGQATTHVESSSTLLLGEESGRFRSRWNEIQGRFVDEPRSAVQQADALVSEVVEQITQMYANEHGTLKSQWNQGSDVSTEDLRKVLQRYRSFFGRLVD